MINNILNPVIWDNANNLKEDVKSAVLNIVEQFKQDLKAPVEITDIRIVGSNASYNYNEHSDIDIHLVVNNEVLPYDNNILKLLYNSARNRFNKEYDIHIKGLPIELSIEDITSTVTSNGVYSILENKWLKFPEQKTVKTVDMTKTDAYQKLTQVIEDVLSNPTSTDIKQIINQLYMIRKNSIMIDGEYGKGNLLFKAIRNSGLLDKLKIELYNILSKELTLESYLENVDINGALRFMED